MQNTPQKIEIKTIIEADSLIEENKRFLKELENSENDIVLKTSISPTQDGIPDYSKIVKPLEDGFGGKYLFNKE